MNKLKKTYRKIFPDYLKELASVLGGCESLLDVGCGNDSPIRYLRGNFRSAGVDVFEPSIRESKEKGIHDEYHQMDLLNITEKFGKDSFDCVLSSDSIEHLTKDDGFRLLDAMEFVARKKVIVFTPNGFLPQGEYGNNPWQVHKSGWTPEEMRPRGYHVIGINGWKPLRGEYAAIRLHPRSFWTVISDLSQILVRNNPETAFQILCIKDISANKNNTNKTES